MNQSDPHSRKSGPIRRLERLEEAEHQAKIAKLKESAPTLTRGRKTTVYALLGSTLTLLTLAAFYMTFQVYQAYLEQQEQTRYIQVEPAPVVEASDLEKTLKRIEEDQASQAKEYENALKKLKKVDLLEELDNSESP